MTPFKQATGVMAVAAVALLMVVAGASAGKPRVYLATPPDDNEHVDLLYKPKTAVIDDGPTIRNITWSKWSSGEAKGRGTAGKRSVRILLNYPDSDVCDKPVWSRAAVTPQGGHAKKYKLDPMCFGN